MKITFVNPLTVIHKGDPTNQDQLDRIEEAIHTMTTQEQSDYATLKAALDQIASDLPTVATRLQDLLTRIGSAPTAAERQALIAEAQQEATTLHGLVPAPTPAPTDGTAPPATT